MDHSHTYRRIGALAFAAVALAACTDTAPPEQAAAAAGDPKTLDGAKVAAQTLFDRFSSGDFSGAWDMHTTAVQTAITKADYVKLNETCSRKGLAISLASARMEGEDKAIVVAKQLVSAQSYTMVYQGDAWKLEPDKAGLALYAKGADKAIAMNKKAGTCANA